MNEIQEQVRSLQKDDLDPTERALEEAQLLWVKELCQNHTEDAVRTLVEVATALEMELEPDKELGKFLPKKDEEGKVIPLRVAPAARRAAARDLIEQGWGRASAQTPVGGDTNRPVTVVIQQFSGGVSPQETIIEVEGERVEPARLTQDEHADFILRRTSREG